MRWSKSHVYTLREAPSDAEIVSHQLLIRGGFIKKMAPGVYTYGPLLLRSIRKLEKIVREELDSRDGIEILMPILQRKDLWQESQRWLAWDADLFRLKNRSEHEFCLGPTHEEVITDFVRNDIRSYRDLPKNFYQIQTKFRDEIRPRFGLMRGKEFLMKDGYSFDVDETHALKSYALMYEAYNAIFSRLGLSFRVVKADTGAIGGSQSHEFQVVAESGEDHLMVCNKCEFAANREIAPAKEDKNKSFITTELKPIEEFATPGLKTIAELSKSLKINESELVKTLFYSIGEDSQDLKPIAILLRGSDELNPIKLKKALNIYHLPLFLTDNEIKNITGANPGSCGPVGLKIPIYVDHSVENLVNFIVGANKDGFHLKNVNRGRDFKETKCIDVRMAKEGDLCPECEGHLKSVRGIEVGHIFYLGTKYSTMMKAHYLDKNGKSLPIEMGCYGIGIGRTVQAAIEQWHDSDGIIWPKMIAPFLVHIVLLDPQDPEVQALAVQIETELMIHQIDVFIDDRDERPGVKFKDADLLGMPLRLMIGTRGLKEKVIEWVDRKTREKQKIEIHQVCSEVIKWRG